MSGLTATTSAAGTLSRTDISTSATNPSTTQNATINSLVSGTQYYFRLFTADEYPNWSSISNASTATASAPPPVNYYWTGATNSTWTLAGNWSPSGPPGTNDIAIVDTNSVNQPIISTNDVISIYSLYIATTGVYGSTLTVNGTINCSSFVWVNSRGVITHSTNTTTELYKSTITAAEMQIDGVINVSGRGFAAGYGAGTLNNAFFGAAHGGQGGTGNLYTDTPSSPYDSYSAPKLIGSGGGTTAVTASRGGGAVILTVTNALRLTGTINADAGAVGGSDSAGAGGSIFLTVGSLVGGGTITVRGGDSASYGGGGGGRIAVVGSTTSFTGEVGLFTTPNPPTRATGQTLTKVWASALPDMTSGSGALRFNSAANSTAHVADTFLWIAFRGTSGGTMPSVAQIIRQWGAGDLLVTDTAGALTSSSTFAGVVTAFSDTAPVLIACKD
jgi:hypothetical protein